MQPTDSDYTREEAIAMRWLLTAALLTGCSGLGVSTALEGRSSEGPKFQSITLVALASPRSWRLRSETYESPVLHCEARRTMTMSTTAVLQVPAGLPFD